MQDHRVAAQVPPEPASAGRRGLATLFIKNVTDRRIESVEFKLEGCGTRWDQNDHFEGNNYTNAVVNGPGFRLPVEADAEDQVFVNLKDGIGPGEEVFVVFRIRNNAAAPAPGNPQTTVGEYSTNFTIEYEGNTIRGKFEITVVP